MTNASNAIRHQPGEKRGRLTFIAEVASVRNGRGEPIRRAMFHCDCGVDYEGRIDTWRRGTTEGCGCVQRERTSTARTTHGRSMMPDPLYRAWTSMRYRSSLAGWRAKPTYAGVRRDPRWDTFDGFLTDPPSGTCAPGMVLSRIGDTGDYTPENCRWITAEENRAEMNARRKV